MGKMRGSTELEDLSQKERSFSLSDLAALLRTDDFVVTAELNPPKSASAAVVRRRAEALKGFADALNVTDSNRAMAAMAAIPAASIVRSAGVEPIVQMTGRDRNRIALQADVLGAVAIGIENFVFMSGDDPKQGSHPDAVNVKDPEVVGVQLNATVIWPLPFPTVTLAGVVQLAPAPVGVAVS